MKTVFFFCLRQIRTCVIRIPVKTVELAIWTSEDIFVRATEDSPGTTAREVRIWLFAVVCSTFLECLHNFCAIAYLKRCQVRVDQVEDESEFPIRPRFPIAELFAFCVSISKTSLSPLIH